MKNFFKKRLRLFAICNLLFAIDLLFALPAVRQTIPDASGEYVFFRDNSFKRESYVGFLYYDDSTYAARYFAPAAEGLPAKNVEILFSVNPNAAHLELTGERFATPPQNDDAEIINYIHDLFYELSARRIKLGTLDLTNYKKNDLNFLDAGKKVYDDFLQFGGSVTMIYCPLVPIFNLKKIVDYKGSAAFVLKTAGRLASSEDKSFSTFGMNFSQKKSALKKAKQIKAKAASDFAYEAVLNEKQKFVQKISLDENWKKQNENMWTLENDAFVFLSGIKFPSEIALQGSDFVEAQILRRYIQSSQNSQCDFDEISVFCDEKKIKLCVQKLDTESGRVLCDTKIFGRAASNFYGVFSLAAFEEGYKKNRGYYDKIAKSYEFAIE